MGGGCGDLGDLSRGGAVVERFESVFRSSGGRRSEVENNDSWRRSVASKSLKTANFCSNFRYKHTF